MKKINLLGIAPWALGLVATLALVVLGVSAVMSETGCGPQTSGAGKSYSASSQSTNLSFGVPAGGGYWDMSYTITAYDQFGNVSFFTSGTINGIGGPGSVSGILGGVDISGGTDTEISATKEGGGGFFSGGGMTFGIC